MVKTIRRLLLGASLCVGIGAIASAPATAGSLTNATVTGSASYLTYGSNATNTFLTPNSGAPSWANERSVLGGDISNPTGNIELFSNSESLNNAAFSTYTGVSSLTGQIGGRDLTLSSLTMADWLSPVNTKTFGQVWFEQALAANGLGQLVGTAQGTSLFSAFRNGGGFQRFSDPNVAYVNQDDTTGLISIGLAGHLNARSLLAQSLPTALRSLLPATIQASEIVKYSYNGQSGYLYGFSGRNSGLVERGDGVSHSATYEVSLQGIAPEKPRETVPEPSMMLGLTGLGGFLVSQRRKKAIANS